MKITASAISLNVGDPVESGNFAKEHLGFTKDMADDGFIPSRGATWELALFTCARALRASSSRACAASTWTVCWSSL